MTNITQKKKIREMRQNLLIDGEIFGEVIDLMKNRTEKVEQFGGDIDFDTFHILEVRGIIPEPMEERTYELALVENRENIKMKHRIFVYELLPLGSSTLVKIARPDQNQSSETTD